VAEAKSFTLKSFFSPALVKRLAGEIAAVYPAFPERAFVKEAAKGLDRLELLDRGKQIAAALGRHLPPAYPEAVDVLIRSLGAEHATDELLGAGMAPFFYYPHTVFVAERGQGHFDLSMRAQHELTRRFSCEGSMRPFIARDPERTFAVLARWTKDRNAHVRRLVSECTRLRLPWAGRVAWLDQHPERVLELLEQLRDDPATMVRRSVANNLNDLGKVHPDLLVRTASAWLEKATPERRDLVEHALRSAVKRGDPGALALLGFGRQPSVSLDRVTFNPRRVRIGGRVAMTFSLRSTSRKQQDLLVDVAVHFVKARGATSAKVFKLGRHVLAPREKVDLKTMFSLAVHTTRVPRPGVHAVDAIVNGHALRAGSFDVAASREAGSSRGTRPKRG
jgi:3-methyladenine DNA glycosylase AlkC